jgi:hypothetical protein
MFKFLVVLLIALTSCRMDDSDLDDASIVALKALEGRDCSTMTGCHQCIVGGCDWTTSCNGSQKSKVASVATIFSKGKKCGDPLKVCKKTESFDKYKKYVYQFKSDDLKKTLPQGYFCLDSFEGSTA